MMIIPLYDLCGSNPQLAAKLSGTDGLKVGEFDANSFANPPYICWQIINAGTQQYLNKNSDMDDLLVQIDIYAVTKGECRLISKLVRQVIEDQCYIEGYTGIMQDAETKLFRISIDATWLEEP